MSMLIDHDRRENIGRGTAFPEGSEAEESRNAARGGDGLQPPGWNRFTDISAGKGSDFVTSQRNQDKI